MSWSNLYLSVLNFVESPELSRFSSKGELEDRLHYELEFGCISKREYDELIGYLYSDKSKSYLRRRKNGN